MEVRYHGWNAEACENYVSLLENVTEFSIQCPLVVISWQFHEVNDVGLESCTQCQQWWAKHVNLEILIHNISVHLHVDADDLILWQR